MSNTIPSLWRCDTLYCVSSSRYDKFKAAMKPNPEVRSGLPIILPLDLIPGSEFTTGPRVFMNVLMWLTQCELYVRLWWTLPYKKWTYSPVGGTWWRTACKQQPLAERMFASVNTTVCLNVTQCSPVHSFEFSVNRVVATGGRVVWPH